MTQDKQESVEQIAKKVVNKWYGCDDFEMERAIIEVMKSERSKADALREENERLKTDNKMLLDCDDIRTSHLNRANKDKEKLRQEVNNLRQIIGSLDVDDPKAVDALLQTMKMQKEELSILKAENERLREGIRTFVDDYEHHGGLIGQLKKLL